MSAVTACLSRELSYEASDEKYKDKFLI